MASAPLPTLVTSAARTLQDAHSEVSERCSVAQGAHADRQPAHLPYRSSSGPCRVGTAPVRRTSPCAAHATMPWARLHSRPVALAMGPTPSGSAFQPCAKVVKVFPFAEGPSQTLEFYHGTRVSRIPHARSSLLHTLVRCRPRFSRRSLLAVLSPIAATCSSPPPAAAVVLVLLHGALHLPLVLSIHISVLTTAHHQ